MSGDLSLRQESSFACAVCGDAIALDAWVVIDASHRPDLVAQAAADELNVAACPTCGAGGVADTPLVVWRPGHVPPLLFTPALENALTYEAQGARLMERLAERARSVGAELGTTSAVLTPLRALRRALTEDARAALARQRDGESDDDRAYRLYLNGVAAWLQAAEIETDIKSLEAVSTWGDLGALVRRRPRLPTAATLAALTARRDSAEADGNWTLVHRIDDYRAALGECVEVGPDEAIARHSPGQLLGPRHELTALVEQAERLGPSADVGQRIALYRRAVASVDPAQEPRIWADLVLQLAQLLVDRRDGDVAGQVEEALSLYEELVARMDTAFSARQRATLRNNQAIAYRRRLRGSRSANLHDAIAAYEEAIGLVSEVDAVFAAQARANLASALLMRPGRARATDLAQAIELLEQAAPVLAAGDEPGSAAASLTLGNAYHLRDRPGDAERASAAFLDAADDYRRAGRPALAAMALISSAMADAESGTVAGADRAIAVVEEALGVVTREAAPHDWAQAHLVLANAQRSLGRADEQVEALRSCLEVCTPGQYPVDCMNAAVALGNAQAARAAAAEDGEDALWGEAADAFAVAIEAAKTLYDASDDRRHRENELLERADLHHGAAVAMARAGRLAEAAATLEAGRARRLSELLGHAGDVAGSHTGSAGPGKTQAVVYVVVSTLGGEALIVTAGGVDAVALDGITRQELYTLLARTTAKGAARGYVVGQALGSGVLRAALARVLPILGAAVMAPVAESLRRRGVEDVVLVPCGPLGVLPLHAATYRHRGRRVAFLDEFAVTYAPSAATLSTCQERARRVDAMPARLVALAEPLPSAPPLPFARAELEGVARHFPRVRRLVGPDAGKRDLLDAVPEATHVLLACHGSFDQIDPPASSLFLAGNDRLELRELLEQRAFRNARLVIVSACQSARASATVLPDEYLGLASALLAAGAASVLGTLWPVYDLATALLVGAFVRLYREGDGARPPEPPARALALAQRWLRDVTAGELASLLDEANGELPGLTPAQVIEAATYFSLLEPERQPYADEPITWAGFVLVGAP